MRLASGQHTPVESYVLVESDYEGRAMYAPAPSAISRDAGSAGILRHIYISKGHDYWGRQGAGRLQNGITEVTEIECLAGMGLKGDRYCGKRPNYKGQVTFLDLQTVEEIRRLFKLSRLPASVFRRNLIVEGLNLRALLGKRFVFQGICFEGSQECTPCHWMDRVVAPGTEAFMKEEFRGGLRARVLEDGVLRVGM